MKPLFAPTGDAARASSGTAQPPAPPLSPPAARAPAPPARPPRRNLAIAGGVLLFHVAALWALNSGLLRRAAEVVVPVELLAQLIEPPQPEVVPPAPVPPPPVPPPPAPRTPPPAPVRKVERTPPPPAPAPRPVAVPDPAPAPPAAPVGELTPQPPAPPIAAPVAPAPPPPAPVAPPAPLRVELPSTTADYLQNPTPAYPPVSKRLGEQGKVVLRVLIGTDGTAQQAEIKQSSGFERLDRTALETVLKWRYVPGKRGGVPEAMWFDVPINFVLE